MKIFYLSGLRDICVPVLCRTREEEIELSSFVENSPHWRINEGVLFSSSEGIAHAKAWDAFDAYVAGGYKGDEKEKILWEAVEKAPTELSAVS